MLNLHNVTLDGVNAHVTPYKMNGNGSEKIGIMLMYHGEFLGEAEYKLPEQRELLKNLADTNKELHEHINECLDTLELPRI
jgi:hypothetical protein